MQESGFECRNLSESYICILKILVLPVFIPSNSEAQLRFLTAALLEVCLLVLKSEFVLSVVQFDSKNIEQFERT